MEGRDDRPLCVDITYLLRVRVSERVSVTVWTITIRIQISFILGSWQRVVFATRCYATAALAVMRCLSVRPCVCLSVTFVDYVKTNKHIFIFLKPLGSKAILFFSVPNGMAIFRLPPPRNGGVKCRWGRQKSRFWAYMWLHCELWTVCNTLSCDGPWRVYNTSRW